MGISPHVASVTGAHLAGFWFVHLLAQEHARVQGHTRRSPGSARPVVLVGTARAAGAERPRPASATCESEARPACVPVTVSLKASVSGPPGPLMGTLP